MSEEDRGISAGETMRSIAERVREMARENERLFQEVLAGEQRFRRLARAVWRVQEEERRRLARELHDGIGQTLTALKNHLGRMQATSAGASPSPAQADLDQALEIATQALADTRELSRLLRPAVLDDLGLEPALRWLARSVGERMGLAVELRAQGLDERLDPELETLVFRVVQEALTNVVKHAGTAAAVVEVERAPGRLRVSISDAGRGFDADAALGGDGDAGVGLRAIRDRAELFSGNVRVDSRSGQGTKITVSVPLGRKEEGAR